MVLINCINNSAETVSRYDWFFFYLSTEDYYTITELKLYGNGINHILIRENYIPETNEQIIQYIQSAYSVQNYPEISNKCEAFQKHILLDYNYQNRLFWGKIVIISLLSIIIFFLGKIISINNLKKLMGLVLVQGDFIISAVKSSVKKETVETILKLSSVITVVATIGGTLMSQVVGGFSWFLIVTTTLCAVNLLLSVLFGVIAINNDSEKYSRRSYTLFILGLTFFIILILEIIVLFPFVSGTFAFKQALMSILTNSTITP